MGTAMIDPACKLAEIPLFRLKKYELQPETYIRVTVFYLDGRVRKITGGWEPWWGTVKKPVRKIL